MLEGNRAALRLNAMKTRKRLSNRKFIAYVNPVFRVTHGSDRENKSEEDIVNRQPDRDKSHQSCHKYEN